MPSTVSDQHLQALLLAVECAGIGTWEWFLDNGQVRRNHIMALFSGDDATALYISGTHFLSAVFSTDLGPMRTGIASAIHDHLPFAGRFRFTRHAEPMPWFRTNGTALYDADGRATSLVGVTFVEMPPDNAAFLTSHVLADQATLLASARAAHEMADRADRLKDEFLATLSHELRTPLNAVLGWAQILRLKTTSCTDDIQRGLEAIERNARLQTKMIDDLLDMSRVISGKATLETQRMYPVDVIEAAIDALLPSATAKGVRLTCTLAPGIGPLLADPARLQQIIGNLLSNAIKFTPRGGDVHLILSRVGDKIRIEITDTGIGIAPECIEHVFDRFRELHATASRAPAGLGLGLAIVKQLVKLHGGSVQATSPGKGLGTTVALVLPLASG